MVRAFERRGNAGAREPAAVTSVMAATGAAALGVPRVPATIPSTLRSPGRDAVVARLALLMLESGMIPETRMIRSRHRLERICIDCFSSWIRTRLGKLKVFSPNFALVLRPYDRSAGGDLCLAWGSDGVEAVVIGPAMRVLAHRHPRLPGTVLSAIRRAGWHSIPVFGFDDQLDVCESYLWGGAEDAAEYAQDVGMDEDEAAAFLESAIKRKDVVTQTPPEAFRFWRNRFRSPRRLATLQGELGDLPLQRVIELTLELATTPAVDLVTEFHRSVAEQGADFIGHGALLRWSESDLTPDVYQLHGEYLYNSGCAVHDACVHYSDLGDLTAFQSCLDGLARTLEILRTLDELLWLLCAEEWSSYPKTRSADE